jgi:hypothetical protein
MSIKAAQIIHDSGGYVVNRIQSAGPGNINIAEETIYEVGNYQSVGTVRDNPDLSFDVESFAVNCEVEALATGADPGAVIADDTFDMSVVRPLDIISPFKSGDGAFDIVRGISIPELVLERANYRFGLRQNATQQFTFRGDSIFYIPGSPYMEALTNSGTAGPEIPWVAATTAIAYNTDTYALNVRAFDSTTGVNKRLRRGIDYTDSSSGITLTDAGVARAPAVTYDSLAVVYGSATAATYNQGVHNTTAPAAIRGRDIELWVEDSNGANTWSQWTTVQSVDISWSVSLEADEEFGSAVAITRDYQVPEVSGSVTIKAEDPADLWTKIEQIAGTPATEITGPLSAAPLNIRVALYDPDNTTDELKRFEISDAKFQVPAISARQQSKLEVTFNFTSVGGNLLIENESTAPLAT